MALLSVGLLNSCLKETYDTAYVSETEIATSPTALEATARACIAWMTVHEPFTQTVEQGFGYPAQMIIKDALTADMPTEKSGYDRFSSPWGSLSKSLSEGNALTAVWRWYYGMSLLCNITMRAIEDVEAETQAVQQYYGISAFHRAFVYFDMCRMYEHRASGVSKVDDQAKAADLWGLTTLIIDENTPDDQLTNNPRVPYWHMYRFILSDLNRAEKYLANYTRKAKNEPDLDVVYALKARFWLEVGTRFIKLPQDLTTQLAHDNDEEINHLDKLGITSAKECFQKAYDYADKVINSGANYKPLSQAEWFDVNNGFNNSTTNSSWVYGAIMGGADAFHLAERSFTGNMSTEYNNGNCSIENDRVMRRMIGADLFDQIPAADWRKTTWVDPKDKGKAPGTKYETSYTDDKFMKLPSYANLKFRPRGGNEELDKVASTGDIPIIRIEDMHFIKIETMAHLQGYATAKTELESFMNTYRYTDNSYSITPTDLDDFIDFHLILQRRIEFWGEGITYYDLKRRNLAVTRGYTGTNFLSGRRYNSVKGYVPGWFTFFLPRSTEVDRNEAAKQNPVVNVEGNYPEWK